MSKQNELKNIVATGTITGTSNKQTQKFKTDNPRKSIYFVPSSEEESKKLQDNGFTLYTPQKEGEPSFFIIKASESLDVYNNDGEILTELPASISDPNFKIEGICGVAILQGESETGNDYSRLYSLLVNKLEDIEKIEKTNPFANL